MTPASSVSGAANSPARVAFATPAWFAMLGEVLAALPVAGANVDGVSFSEIYHHVPREVAGHDGPVGWSVVAEGGRLDYRPQPDLEADIVIELDYVFAVESLQEHDGGDEAALGARKALVAAAGAAGRFVVRGDLRSSPKALEGLHDALAARTSQA